MESLSGNEIKDMQKEYVMGTYAPELLLVRGEMSKVWDEKGNEYLDFATGISVCNLGHCNPKISSAVREQANILMHVSNLFYNENQPLLAREIALHSFKGKVFFCNSGAEANEGMIKFARKWGNQTGRNEIISMDASFHGRTLTTLAATGRSQYREGFEPDVPGFKHVPFNNLKALEEAVTDKTCAILLEPVQGEGGIIPASAETMQFVRNFCDKNNLLMLLDEVQTGIGRTGKFFGYQHYGIEPDAMSMAKALGNGVPIGAFEVQNKYADVLVPGTHASTFGGNPLACAAGIAVWETIDLDNIMENVEQRSAEIFKALEEMKSKGAPFGEIRGKGLMIGVDLTVPVKDVMTAARKKGLLILSAGKNTLRMLPPLTITQEEAEHAMIVLSDIFKEMQTS